MGNRTQELNALKEIQSLLRQRERLDEKADICIGKISECEGKITDASYESLPTNNKEKLENELKTKYWEKISRTNWLIGILSGISMVVDICLLVLQIYQMNYGEDVYQPLILTVVLLVVGIGLCIGNYYGWGALSVIGSLIAAGKFIVEVWPAIWIHVIALAAIGAFWGVSALIINKTSDSGKYILKYLDELDHAGKLDEKNRKENERRESQAQENVSAKEKGKLQILQDQLDSYYREIENIDAKIESMDVINKDDWNNVDYLIERISSRRSDSIKEALIELDRKNNERKRREKEAALEKAAEESARRAAMPGRLNIIIYGVNSYSGTKRSVRNVIYIDGQPYGSGAMQPTTIQLNPGPHTLYVRIRESDDLYTSPAYSFNLQSDGDVYLRVVGKLLEANIYVHESETSFLNAT